MVWGGVGGVGADSERWAGFVEEVQLSFVAVGEGGGCWAQWLVVSADLHEVTVFERFGEAVEAVGDFGGGFVAEFVGPR